jgi:hypothetical protein
MTRYYFHIRDGNELIQDDRGLELPGAADTLETCMICMREVLQEDEWRCEISETLRFDVMDDSGRSVLIVPFVDCLYSAPGRRSASGRLH